MAAPTRLPHGNLDLQERKVTVPGFLLYGGSHYLGSVLLYRNLMKKPWPHNPNILGFI